MNDISQFWTGTAGNDVYTGDQNDEFIDGWTGNDILAGGLGDDFILGGDGFDAAKFSGDLNEYLFGRTEDGKNVVVLGPDGQDTLSFVESVIFDDVAVPIVNSSWGFGGLNTIFDAADSFYAHDLFPWLEKPLPDVSINLTDGRTVRIVLGEIIDIESKITAQISAQVFDQNGNEVGEEIILGSLSSYAWGFTDWVALTPLLDGNWAVQKYISRSNNGYPLMGDNSPSVISRAIYDSDGMRFQGTTPPLIDYAVKIIGLSEEGLSLSVDATAVLEEYPLTSLSYQWRKNGIAIENATEGTYSLEQEDVGASISVTVSLTDENDLEQSFTSDFTRPVVNSNDLPEGDITLNGILEAGSVLTVDTSNLSDADTLGALSYHWLRNGLDIAGEISYDYSLSNYSYTLGINDIGSEISVRVSYTDGFGTQEAVTSTASGVVLPDADTRITGTEEPDWLAGSNAGQFIEGLAGNDTILGGGGADFLQGGTGNDLLSGEGTLAASFGLTIANQVFRLYQSALDRTPDPAGHAAWSERIASGELTILEVADSFVRSPEFTQTYANLSNSEFVELLYNNVLDRASDPTGLARWTQDLEQGATRAELLKGFSQSPEFINSTTIEATHFAINDTASDWTDAVYRLYSATLDREPDIGGLQGWSTRLGNGEITLLEATTGFIQSREFQNVYNDLPDAAFVTLLYRNVLDRQPDSGGLARWTEQLESGATRAEIVLGFSESTQFKSNSASLLEDWMRDKGTDDILDAGAGDNTLYGGMLSDTFVFDAAQGGTHLVMDLETWDTLDFRGFGYASDDDIREHMTQVDTDVIFSDQDLSATFVGVDLAVISDAMLL